MSPVGSQPIAGDPIRVAICITGLEVGGAETMLAELLKYKPEAYDIRVFSLIDGGPIATRIEALGIEVTGLHMKAGRPSIRSLLSFARQLREFRPTIVHTWLYHADLLGGIAAKLAGVPHVIWHLHNSDLSPARVRTMTRLVVKTCALLSRWIPDVIVSCAEAAVPVHRALGYAADKFLVIPNGVDTDRFMPSAEARLAVRAEFGLASDVPLIGLVARVDPQKNHEGFFDAVREFFERGGDADFLLVGRDVTPDHWQIPVWRDATGHPERIVLGGPRSDVDRIMPALDIATSSSLGEAFPMVLIEAMACGVPCVATNVGDSAFIVGDTGISVAADDAVALANGWLTVLAQPAEEREQLGRKARDRALDEFSIRRTSARVWRLYELVEAGTPPHERV